MCHQQKCLSSCVIPVLSQTRLSVIASLHIEHFNRNMQIYAAMSVFISAFYFFPQQE